MLFPDGLLLRNSASLALGNEPPFAPHRAQHFGACNFLPKAFKQGLLRFAWPKRNFRRQRPATIPKPEPSQESVWDYPRPPAIQSVAAAVRVRFGGIVLAESQHALRVIETASPPVYYLPPDDVQEAYLLPNANTTICEWKGRATYWDVRVGEAVAEMAAWSYPEPLEGYDAIRGYYAFYAGKMETCTLGEKRVRAQEGDFYGGWITDNLVGPFKGAPGSEGW